jgi:hypothetical protein
VGLARYPCGDLPDLHPHSAHGIHDANPERRNGSKIKSVSRIGEVTDIMGGVVYHKPACSALVTGTSLLIDGGWTAE